MVQYFLGMHRDLGSIPNTRKKGNPIVNKIESFFFVISVYSFMFQMILKSQ